MRWHCLPLSPDALHDLHVPVLLDAHHPHEHGLSLPSYRGRIASLASVNLSRFLQHPFDPLAEPAWSDLERALRLSVRFLDNVIDSGQKRHLLPAQRRASLRSRRIGVGFTGFADALIQLGLRYDSPAALQFADRLFAFAKHTVYDESTKIAAEKGPFAAFDHSRHMRSPFMARLGDDVTSRIGRYGLRNAALLAVAPAGSVSILAGCSSGIEPVFALIYKRRSTALSRSTFEIRHPLVTTFAKHTGIMSPGDLPRTFVTAHQVDPRMCVLNRRRTIMVADLVNGVLTFVVGLAAGAGHFSVPIVYAPTFLVTFIKTFHNPAIYASIPRMVPSEQLPRANSLLEFGLQAPRIIAPAVGAGLLALGWDVYSLLLLDAATFFFASLTLAMVRFPREQEPPASASKAPKKDNSFQEDMGAGMKYLRANRSLLSILLLTAVINLLGSGLNVLLPPLVTDVFQAGPELLGIIQAAMSAGALTGSVLLIVWGAPRAIERADSSLP
ncbi:MAG TPA: hypothetical protein DEQ28_05450 [Clostridiales bacterium]|nr:hypothetical protein [Clostridiales bacterium]